MLASVSLSHLRRALRRLLLTQDMKYLRKGVLYVLTLEAVFGRRINLGGTPCALKVSNPQTTSATPEDWHVQSYEDLQSPQHTSV